MKINPTDGFGSPPTRRIAFGEPEFRVAAITRFPDLRDELEEWPGLIHLQMGALARAARIAISEDNAERFVGIVNFLDEILAIPDLDPEIDNAVWISFLSAAELRTTELGRGAWSRLPLSIRERLTEYERGVNEAFHSKKRKRE